MIDIHCHILAGIDDGARNIGTSIEMLRIAQEDGIKTIIATPHYNDTYYDTEFCDVENYVLEFKKIAQANNLIVEILPGQEINIRRSVLKLYKEGKIGCLNKTRYMLVELDYGTLENADLEIIYELRVMGIVPVIPHPERYSYIMHKPQLINSLSNEGCLFQLNEGSIKGLFGKEIKKTSDILLNNGICNFIASDAHSTGKRSPRLHEVFDIIDTGLGERVKNNMGKLVINEEIHYNAEKIKEKQSIFSIFKR